MLKTTAFYGSHFMLAFSVSCSLMFVEIDSFSYVSVYVKTSYLGQEHISIHSRNNKKNYT